MKNQIMKNQIKVYGTVTNAPEVVTLQSGKMYVKCRLVTYAEIVDTETGELKKAKQWHNLVAWGAKASFIEKTMVKGRRVSVLGTLRESKYTNQAGKAVEICELNIDRVLHLGEVKIPVIKVASSC